MPFREAIAGEIPLIMVANASYPGLGGKDPATLDRAIATGLLRDDLGFEGVSITDDLQAGAISTTLEAPDAAQTAARAGVDLLLFAGTLRPRYTRSSPGRWPWASSTPRRRASRACAWSSCASRWRPS